MISTYITEKLMRAIGDVATDRSKEEFIVESEKLYKRLKLDVQDVMNGKEDVIITRIVDRKIGKSYSLLKLACEFNIPIVTNRNMGIVLKRDALRVFGKEIQIVSVSKGGHYEGRSLNIVLKEQGVSEKMVNDYFWPLKVKMVGINSIWDD